MKRPRSERSNSAKYEACNGTLRFYCSTGDFVVRQLGPDGADFEDGISQDSLDFVMHFRPPLEPERAARTVVAVRYQGAKYVANSVLFSHLLEPLESGVPLVLREQELEYRCYDTYALHVKQGRVYALHLSVENAMTSGPSDGTFDLRLQVHVDTRLRFLRTHLGQRAVFLNWFPSDVDPALYGLRVDPRRIPQRTPLWFKLRGEVTGSRAYALLGYYLESGPMTFVQKGQMRLGTFSEDLLLLTYLYRFPDRTFYEMGWCPAPAQPPGRYPLGWGASPDGAMLDPQMTWERLPPEIAAQYETPESRAGIDITRGGVEFKTSRAKLCMEPYFLAQVYMCMIALGVVWWDVVRYRVSRTWDAERDAWRYDDTAHVYRVYRDRALEDRLIKLWKHAQTNQHVLVETVKEPAFVAMRADLKRMAQDAKPYAVVHVAQEPALSETLQAYAEYKTQMVIPDAPMPVQSTPGTDWDTLATRLQELRTLPRDSPRFTQLVSEQIQEYASLLMTV